MRFKTFLLICFTLFGMSCQTTGPVQKAQKNEPILAWDEILTKLQTGQFNLHVLSVKNALILQHSLDPMIKSHEWSRLTFIIERLAHSPSDIAQLLALHLKSGLAFEQGDFALVETYSLQILGMQPDNESAKLSLGLVYLYGSQFAKAIPYLNATKPHPKAVAGLISAHRQLGNNDIVDALCDKYQSEQAELWEISFNCSLFEAQNMQAPEKALKTLQATLDKQPADSDASRHLRAAITQIEVARTQPLKDQDTM